MLRVSQNQSLQGNREGPLIDGATRQRPISSDLGSKAGWGLLSTWTGEGPLGRAESVDGPDMLPTAQPGGPGGEGAWGVLRPHRPSDPLCERLELALSFTSVLSPSFTTSAKCVKEH